VSPRPKHIPSDAHKTTIGLTDLDLAAINWIKAARRARRNDRKTLNDIVVDALWFFLEKIEGKTKEEMQGTIPPPQANNPSQSNVTQMPKPKNRR
jgi:hypothetical protein